MSLPIDGGSVSGPERLAPQAAQSSHQEPACRSPPERHCWGSSGYCSPVTYQAFGEGGLTMPAMWPPLDNTNRASPLMCLRVAYDEVHGTMWSLMAETMYRSWSTSPRSSVCPRTCSRPLTKLFCM